MKLRTYRVRSVLPPVSSSVRPTFFAVYFILRRRILNILKANLFSDKANIHDPSVYRIRSMLTASSQNERTWALIRTWLNSGTIVGCNDADDDDDGDYIVES